MDPNEPRTDARTVTAGRSAAPSMDETDRARALLAATNAFLVCEDLDAVGRAIAEAMDAMFAPDKIGVTIIEPDGTVRVPSTIGYTADEQKRISDAVTVPLAMVRRVLGGEGLWSDDLNQDEFRTRIALYGATAGFSLPITTPSGVVGTCSALYIAPRTFDESFRNTARSLAAQAGLTASLIGSRDEVVRSAAETARRHRTSAALLDAASRLATLVDPVAIPQAIADATREATGALSAAVARQTPDGTGFVVISTSGMTAERSAAFHGRVLTATAGSGAEDLLAGRPTTRLGFGSPVAAAAGVRSTVAAPIPIGRDVWGFVALADPDARFGPAELQDLAVGFAAIAATAIARAEATAELDRQRRRSDTLLELSSALAGIQDSPAIAPAVCAFVRRASGAPYAMVGRLEIETGRFAVAATDGLDPNQVERIEAALRTADRPSLRELLRGAITARTGEASVGAGMGIEQAMGAPILIDGQTAGFIAIGAPPGHAVLAGEWQELLTAFAALTATALARAEAVGALARQRDILASEVEERTRSLRTALDELRLASDAKTDFLANVSHELRTPLTAILGFVEILAAGIDGPLNADQQRDVETIQTSSHHLLELIDDLIDVASIESGRIQLQIAPIAAADIVRDAAETIRPLAGAKGIALDFDASDPVSGGAGILVAADRGRLREIVLNLLSNAVKFTPSGGRVQIAIRVEPADPARDGDPGADPAAPVAPVAMVAIEVRDSGPGVEPTDQERIFEKFVRIAPAVTPGTGLGLAISRELARLHGGDLVVESTVGLGSTFTVRIPQMSAG